jgi:hypothetical protein
MSFVAKEGAGSDIPPIPDGLHRALCCWLVDLGRQRSEWNGEERIKHEVIVTFEFGDLSHVFDPEKGEERRIMSKFFTLSLHANANLRKFLQAWRGKPFSAEELKGFDVSKVLGASCQLLIQTEETTKGPRQVIANVMPYKGEAFQSSVGLVKYSVTEPDEVAFEHLPEWIQQKCLKSLDWPDRAADHPTDDSSKEDWKDEDKIPF